MSSTPRLGLPFLSAGQAQKELFHNEALQLLDALVAPVVEEPPRAAPPPAPVSGACYLTDLAPTDVWTGKPSHLAAYTEAGWRFIPPQDGMSCFVRSAGCSATYSDGSWKIGEVTGSSLVIGGQQVVGGRLGGIAEPSGGAVADSEARAAIGQILAALRQHGLIQS